MPLWEPVVEAIYQKIGTTESEEKLLLAGRGDVTSRH